MYLFMGYPSADQIVDIGSPLGPVVQCVVGGKDIVIDDVRTMAHLYVEIAAVAIKEIPTDPGPLGLPVQPHSHGTVVNAIIVDLYVNWCMKLDAANLMSIELPFQTNVVNVVVMDLAKDTPKVAHDSVLTTVINPIVANDMRPDFLLAPTYMQGIEHRFDLVMIARFIFVFRAINIPRGHFFTNTNATAFGVMDDVLLNNPPFAQWGPSRPG